MKKWQQIMISAALLVGVVGVVAPMQPASAINVFDQCATDATKDSAVCKASSKDDASSTVKDIVNIMLYILGVLAVIMIVFSGIRYTTSAGNAAHVKAAKDTLMYSVIGLVVAMLAWTIVNFVLGKF